MTDKPVWLEGQGFHTVSQIRGPQPSVTMTTTLEDPKPTYVISPFTQTLILCPKTGAVYDRHEAQERMYWLVWQTLVAGDTLAEAYIRQIGDLVRAMRQLKDEET